jgi:hypothetical protein
MYTKFWLQNLKNRQYLADLNENGENNKIDLQEKGEKHGADWIHIVHDTVQ